jgi:uncharacterized BrkB/YihY/UPF0761 family membrane protein
MEVVDENPAAEPAPEAQPSRRGRMQGWVAGRREQLEAARTTSPSVEFAFDALSYDTDTGAPVLAAALGFRVFLFQVPYACAAVIATGIAADIADRDATSLFHARGISGLMASSVSTAAQLSGWARLSGLLLALYALFLSARSFLKVVNIVHALVWDVPRSRLPRASHAAVVFILFITVLVAVSMGVAALLDRNAIGGIAVLVLYTAGPFSMWWFASWRLPHRPCPPIALVPGAALFAIGVEILQIVTVVWFPRYIESKSELYGSIGVAVVLLLWAYLLGRIITLAVVLNAALWKRFGTESAHPLNLVRPSWHLPLLDDQLSRFWTAIFGDHD